MSVDKLPVTFSEDEKGWLMNSLDVKRQQIRRALNNAVAGSSMARSLIEDDKTVSDLIIKVGRL